MPGLRRLTSRSVPAMPSRPRRDQREQHRRGHAVGGLRRLEHPRGARAHAALAQGELGGRAAALGRRPLGRSLGRALAPGLAGRGSSGPAIGATAAAVSGRGGLHPAADGRGDDRPAIAVLVEIGRDLAERGAPVGLRVLAVDGAVRGAIPDHSGRVGRRRGRQGQDRESGREHTEMSHSSGHAENALPVRIKPVHGRNALNQLPQASNWFRRVRPGSFILLLRPPRAPGRRPQPRRPA